MNKKELKKFAGIIKEQVNRRDHPDTICKNIDTIVSDPEHYLSNNPVNTLIDCSEKTKSILTLKDIDAIPLKTQKFTTTQIDYCARNMDLKIPKSHYNWSYDPSIFNCGRGNDAFKILLKHNEIFNDMNKEILDLFQFVRARRIQYKFRFDQVISLIKNGYDDTRDIETGHIEALCHSMLNDLHSFYSKHDKDDIKTILDSKLNDLFSGSDLNVHRKISIDNTAPLIGPYKIIVPLLAKYGIFINNDINYEMSKELVEILNSAVDNNKWIERVHKPVYNEVVKSMFQRNVKQYFEDKEVYDKFFEMFCRTNENRRMTSNKTIVRFCKTLCKKYSEHLSEDDYPEVIVAFYGI